MKILQTIITLIILAYSTNSYALRCNSKIVSVGDSTYKFFSLCGEPDFVEKRTAYRTRSVTGRHIILDNYPAKESTKQARINQKTISNRTRSSSRRNTSSHKYVNGRQVEYSAEEVEEVQIEEWTYDFGPRRLVQQVIFVNGVATKIKNMGYGVDKSK